MEPDAPDMLSLDMIAGTRKSFSTASTVLLSQSTAKALFGNEDPIGKVVKIDADIIEKVVGVYKDFPENSSFKDVKFIAPFRDLTSWVNGNENNWYNESFQVFVQLAANADMQKISAKIKDIKLNKVDAQTAKLLPHVLNPDKGFYNTSNDYQVPPGYQPHGSDSPRLDRSLSRPRRGRGAGLGPQIHRRRHDAAAEQRSLHPGAQHRAAAARHRHHRSGGAEGGRSGCCTGISCWTRISVEAGIYEMFQRHLIANVQDTIVPAAARGYRQSAHDAHHRLSDRAGWQLRRRSAWRAAMRCWSKAWTRRWPN